jgi:hypothetical protein
MNQGMRNITAIQLVEDDLRSTDDRVVTTSETMLVQPVPVSLQGLLKPLAMKVVRPIPQRATEQFYNEAYDEGHNMNDTHEAVMVAHEWHRRWTQQDEAGHTMPHQDFYEQQPQHSSAHMDRQGAMNPSLGASLDDSVESNAKRSRCREHNVVRIEEETTGVPVPDLLFHPEDRFLASSLQSASSSLSSYMVPQVKRRFIGNIIDDDELSSPVAQPTAVAVRPLAVRPVAALRPTPVRVSRPDLPPAHEIPHDGNVSGIPLNISALRHHDNVSPMSCSVSDSSMDSDNFMMTLANRQHEQVHVVEEDDEVFATHIPQIPRPITSNVESARDGVLHSLAISQGDVDSDKFKMALKPLLQYFSEKSVDTRPHLSGNQSVDGQWLSLSKPSYFASLGDNDNGDPMYTLGRMSFDMFSPTNLVCSLQGNFNPIEVVSEEQRKAILETVPKSLRDEVEAGNTVLRTYHIVAAFTIESNLASFPDAPNKDVLRPIKGIMTTFGYSLPNPDVENRHSIWFTGGRIEPNNDPTDIFAWKKIFTEHPPKHSLGEKAKLLAVKLLMGATVPKPMADDGSMEYSFTRPLGGHGMAYVDVIYLDETLRIVRGHRGTVMVFSRLPQH